MTDIVLTADEVADADAMAHLTYERWKNFQGHYTNKLSTHRKGKLGEIAIERWAVEMGLHRDSPFRDQDREREADLMLGPVDASSGVHCRVDAKTWDEQHWDGLGRCIAVRQLASLTKKADCIVWCTVSESAEGTVTVNLRGWSTLDDVRKAPRGLTGRPGMPQVDNYQVANADLRPLDELITEFRETGK